MRRSFGALVLVPGLLMGCRRFDDCKLYNTCPGDLIDVAKEMASLAGEAAVAECGECVANLCERAAESCSSDIECNYTARCQLKGTANEYQQCLNLLVERGYTRGTEARKPWEGSIHEDAKRKDLLGDCVHGECKASCGAARFLCDNSSKEYQNLGLTLAVRTFPEPDFKIARGVSVRACYGEPNCTDWATTDENGLRKFRQLSDKPNSAEEDASLTYDLPNNISPELLYFELRPDLEKRADDFPLTFYYPGRLADSGPQHVPVYLVLGDRIATGNTILGRGSQVLKTSAQSLILPDSCIWEQNSLPNVRIEVEDEMVPQCAEQAPCGGQACKPCIWYAASRAPVLNTTETDGTGAGIVGLSTGTHTFSVLDRDEGLISRRTVYMQAGAMTIVRTWPLPKEVRDKLRMH